MLTWLVWVTNGFLIMFASCSTGGIRAWYCKKKVCGWCHSNCSVFIRWYYDPKVRFKRKHLTGEVAYNFRGLVHDYHREDCSSRKYGSGAIAKNTKDLQVTGRGRELETGPGMGFWNLKALHTSKLHTSYNKAMPTSTRPHLFIFSLFFL